MGKKGKKAPASLIPPLHERYPALVEEIKLFREQPIDPVREKENEQLADSIALTASGSDVDRMDIAASGVIVPLVSLLNEGTSSQRTSAATALRSLSYNNPLNGAYDNAAAIVAAGGVPPLISLLRDESSVEIGADALCNLASNSANRTAIAQGGAIPLLLRLVLSEKVELASLAAHALGKLAFSHAENIALIGRLDGKKALAALAAREEGDAAQRARVAYALRTLARPLPTPAPT